MSKLEFSPEVRKEMRRRHAIGWLQILALLAAIAMLVWLITSTTIAKADESIGFPSFWEHDATLVKNTQRTLNHNGARLKVDGHFGPKTARWVKNLQIRYGLEPTGVVNDELAQKIGIADWPYGKGYTLYYQANLQRIYVEEKEYEDLPYIALGGESKNGHFSFFRDGTLIAETDMEIENPEDFPLGIVDLHELKKLGLLEDALPENLLAWLYANEPRHLKVVIDDRAYQPSSLGYDTLLEGTEYADWD